MAYHKLKQRSKANWPLWLNLGLGLAWLISLFLGSFFGAYPLEASRLLKVISELLSSSPPTDPIALELFLELRLPRVLLAALIGGALSLSGLLLQAVLKNSLADPFTLGISQGAACGASLVLSGELALGTLNLSFGPASLVSLAAFFGATVATIGTLILGTSQGQLNHNKVILAGIAVATFLGSLVALIKALNEESLSSIVFWIMGSFQGRGFEDLPLLGFCFLPALLILSSSWRSLDLFFLEDDNARALGLKLKLTRLSLLLAASLLTAGSVAVCGVIGFVGLVVPHLLRLLLGPTHPKLLLSTFLGGGILLIWADVLARSLLAEGQEIPVGVVTSFLGGPFLAYLLHKKQGAKQFKKDLKKTKIKTLAPSRSPQGYLVLDNLSAGYGENLVLKNFSLTLNAGDFLLILGQNGSGKSTLLKAIAGLLPYNGHISLLGQNLANLSPKQRAQVIACVPQNPRLPLELTVRDFVLLGRYPHLGWFSRLQKVDQRAVNSALEATETLGFQDRPLGTLSGGQRQRVLLALALAQGSKILLLDELAASLDLNSVLRIFELLTKLSKQGYTILCALHDYNLAQFYANKLIALDHGEKCVEAPLPEALQAEKLSLIYQVPMASLPLPQKKAWLSYPKQAGRFKAES